MAPHKSAPAAPRPASVFDWRKWLLEIEDEREIFEELEEMHEARRTTPPKIGSAEWYLEVEDRHTLELCLSLGYRRACQAARGAPRQVEPPPKSE